MSVVATWIANGGSTSGFGAKTAAVLNTQAVSVASEVGIVVSQQFLNALIDAATEGGTA
jgi:hypothetical protein